MCGRYYIDSDMADELEKVVYEVDRKIQEERCKRDIYPTNDAPVIEKTEKGLRLSYRKWGYPGRQGKGVLINARSETVFDSPMFRRGIQHHRIVIPAGGFYEWNSRKEKSTFMEKNSPVLYMAGFYDCFGGENRFVIITTEANESMRKIHDRMPLILEKNQIEQWIEKGKWEKLLRQVPPFLERSTEYEQQTLF